MGAMDEMRGVDRLPMAMALNGAEQNLVSSVSLVVVFHPLVPLVVQSAPELGSLKPS